MKKTELGYNRKKAGDFYDAGYRIENDYIKNNIEVVRKRDFIIFNF